MSRHFCGARQCGPGAEPGGSAPVDNSAGARSALCVAVDNCRSACAATVSHALALAGFVGGYLVTFVLLGGATG